MSDELRAGGRAGTPLRVALVQRVLSPYRLPVFEKLADRPDLWLRVFFGRSLRGTKVRSVDSAGRLDACRLPTWSWMVKSSGRDAALVFHPTLLFHLLRYRPDVLLCEGRSNFADNVAILLYAKLSGAKLVWWSLGALPQRRYRGISALYLRLAQFVERQADAWLAYSSEGCRYFEGLGLPKERIFRALNCIDTDAVFAEMEEVAERVEPLRRELALEGRWVVLFVGALDPQKRVDRLLRAFSRVHAVHRDAALLIVGDGAARRDLEALAAELGIAAATRFAGEVRDGVSAYFLLAQAFVLPGLGGLAIPHAMAHGLPVLCGAADGTERDYVEDGVSGRVLRGGSDEEITAEVAEVLEGWCRDPEAAARLGRTARAVIETRHNVHTFVESIARCLHTVGSPRLAAGRPSS